jgi:hypothetical protein
MPSNLLSRAKWPPERIWSEDYYFLATAFAGLKAEKEAFYYLRKAIQKGWKIEHLKEQTEWQPYRNTLKKVLK